MANLNLKFLRGLQASLPTTGTDGYFYLTTDTHRLYTSIDGKVVPVNEGVTTVANLDALASVTGAKAGDFFYCTEENILTVFNGQNFVQINPDTGATSVEVVGEGNAVTAASYDAATRKLTLTKGEIFALPADISNAVGELGDYDNVKAYVDAKTSGIVSDADLGALAERVTTAEGEIDALQADSHTHTFVDSDVEDAIAKKHTHTFADADVVDAISKKHSHANAAELDKIVEGDKAKWDAVAADHLTSADKTALENSIKEAKKAGTDANTALEAYKVTNDARVLAVEEDIAEITNADNGILAQAKTYSDGKLATARTEVSAEIDADVKVVNDALEAYKSANDTALAGVKATAEAAATKEYTDAELAKKVDKVEGKSLVSDTEITKLAGVSEGANKVEASENNGKIKIDGVETTVYTHPEKHAIAEVDGLGEALAGFQVKGDYAADDHKHVKADITDFAHTHIASEITDLDATIKGYDYATKTEAQGYADAKDEAIAAAQKAGDDAQDAIDAYIESNDAALAAETKAREDADADFETRIATLEGNFGEGDNTVDAKIAAAVAAEAEIARAAEKANADAIDALEGRMDTAEGKISALETESAKHAVKTEVEAALALKADKSVVDAMYTNEQIDAAILVETNRAKGVEEGLQTQINTIMNNPDTEGVINSINEFTQYVKDHGTIADGFRTDIDKNKEDIAANAKAIADHETLAAETYETKTDAAQKLTDAKAYTDTTVATEKTAREAADAELAAAIEAAKVEASNQNAVVLAEAQKYADQAEADAIADAASKYETKGTAQGIVDDLKLSETYEPIGAEERAVAAAKTETENQVKALSDGQVATNKEDIASLFEQLQWGSF